jgi:hypothetical protein
MKISGYKILILLMIISIYYFSNLYFLQAKNFVSDIGMLIFKNFIITFILFWIIILFSIFNEKFKDNFDNLYSDILLLLKYIFKYPIKLLKYLDKLLTKEYKL